MKFLILFLTLFFASVTFAWQAVNVNTADADTIASSLKGVGAKKAAAIVAYREEHGSFKTADELVNVKGIGAKTVEKNREYIIVEVVEEESVAEEVEAIEAAQ